MKSQRPDAWSIFMRWLRRLAERFSVAASLVGHPGDGWRFVPTPLESHPASGDGCTAAQGCTVDAVDSPEPEVTPRMVAVGMAVLSKISDKFELFENEAVTRIYRAMRKAAP
jgi:hypothetical protein